MECLLWGLLNSCKYSSDPTEFQAQLITATYADIFILATVEDSNLLGKKVIWKTLSRLEESAQNNTKSPAGCILISSAHS